MHTRSLAQTRLSTRTRAAALLLAAITALNTAGAASLSWDGSDTSASDAQGGSGTWDANTTANWWNGSANVVWPAAGGTDDDAVFAGTGGNVTLGSAISANDLTFSSTGYVISGAQILTLNGGTAPSVAVSSGLSATLGGNTALLLDGTSGFTKTGTGTLTLNSSAPATVTGGVSVNGGTLALSLANVPTPTNFFPATNSLTVQRGTFAVTGKNGGFNSVQNVNGAAVLSGLSTLSVNNASGTSTTLNLGTVSQTEPGGIVSMVATNGGVGQPNTSSQVIMAANGAGYIGAWAFVNDPRVSARWANINGSGQVTAIFATAPGTNMVDVNSASTVYNIPGSHVLSANRSAFGLQNNDTTNTSINVGGFTLTTSGLAQFRTDAPAGTTLSIIGATGGGGIVIGANKELVAHGKNNITVAVPVMDNPAGASHLTYAGGGTFAITTAASTYTGLTTVNSGTFSIGTGGSINSSSGIKVNGGTFLQSNTSTAIAAPVTVQGGTIGGTGTIDNVTVANLAGSTVGTGSTSALTVGNLDFAGAGTLSLYASASPTLVVTNTLSTNPANGKVAINLATGANWGTSTTYNLLSYGTWNGALSDFTLGALPSLGARKIATLGSTGPSNGTLTLTVAGDSALWTGAANGNWTTTPVGSPFNWVTLAGAAATDFLAGDDVLFDDTATGATAISITDANVATNTVTFNNSSLPYSVSSPGGFGISAGSLTKSGTGTLTLNTSNTYTGGSNVQGGGTLVLGHATNTLADTGAVTVFFDSTLDIGANTDTVGAINLSGGTITGTTGVLTGTAYNFQSGTVAANLASVGVPVLKTTTGTVTITGALNTSTTSGDVIRVSGGSSVSPSTLILSPVGASVTGSSSGNALTVGKAFGDYAVFTQTAGTLNTSSIGIGELGIGTLNLSGGITNTNSVTLAFTGPFSDNGFVNVNVSGDAALNINNNGKLIMGTFYGRKVTINQSGGTVSLFSDAGSTLGGTGSLAFEGGNNASAYNLNGGTLAIPAITLRADSGGAGGGSGTINFGGGTLKITSSFFTVPTVASKTIAFKVEGDGSIPGSGANIDTAGNVVTFNAPLVHGVQNSIDGGLIKLGAGTLSLTAANTYTGPTSVAAGTLSVTSANFNDSAAISVATGAVLDLNFTGSDLVGGLRLGGVEFPSGTYSAATHPAFFTGNGSLNVVSTFVPPGFAAWASGLGLTGVATGDFDSDSYVDALEYVLGTDPLVADKANITTERVGGDLVVTFDRDDRSETPDIAVTVESGTDLATWPLVYTVAADTATSTAGVTIVENGSAADSVTVTIPMGSDTRRFARVKVTVTP